MDIKEEPPNDFYKAVKVPLTHVLKHKDVNLSKINKVVIKAHKVIIHTLHFMKLYLLNCEEHKSLPIIDKTFINSCMKILCVRKGSGRPPKKEVSIENITEI